MDEQEVEIEITAEGKVIVRTHGIKGPQCVDVAKLFASFIGKIESSERTEEYYESSEVLKHNIDVRRKRHSLEVSGKQQFVHGVPQLPFS